MYVRISVFIFAYNKKNFVMPNYQTTNIQYINTHYIDLFFVI